VRRRAQREERIAHQHAKPALAEHQRNEPRSGNGKPTCGLPGAMPWSRASFLAACAQAVAVLQRWDTAAVATRIVAVGVTTSLPASRATRAAHPTLASPT
jgi:hypothetical protein